MTFTIFLQSTTQGRKPAEKAEFSALDIPMDHVSALISLAVFGNFQDLEGFGRQMDDTTATSGKVIGAHLYVFQAASGLVKIGRSNDPKQRCRAIAFQSGQVIHVLKILRNRGSDEGVLHAILWRHRIKGEWFRDGPDFRQSLNDLLGATIPFRDKREKKDQSRRDTEAAVAAVVASIHAQGGRRRAAKYLSIV